MIFEYVIVEHPTKKDADRGELETVLAGPTVIVARDIEHAKTSALLEFGKDAKAAGHKERKIEVIARPFK